MTDTARRRTLFAVPFVVALVLAAWAWSPQPPVTATAAELPTRLTNEQFWTLVESFSEHDGFFRSDNLVSNEDTFQHAIPELKRRVKPGGVYLGVGPDQNFTYIVALKPRIVFIPDVRRGNLHMHLMYKALFELSANRVEFLSRLFSRAAPEGIGSDATAEALFSAFVMQRPDPARYQENLAAIRTHLTERRGFALTAADLSGIEYIFSSFFQSGPYLSYSSRGGGRRGRYPTYQDLQMATDGQGVNHAYLATDANFQLLKTMQQNNLIVPLVGNFAGPKALRAVGEWVRDHGATVTAFYASNVEQYLFQDRIWTDFAENVMTMPLDDTSTFIRSCFNNCVSPYNSRSVTLLDSVSALMADYRAGRIATYWDVLAHSR